MSEISEINLGVYVRYSDYLPDNDCNDSYASTLWGLCMVVTNRTLLLLAIITLGSLSASEPASAQAVYPQMPGGPSIHYQPKLSPYLNLLRGDDSVLGPYRTFVLPQQRLYQQQVNQTVQIGRLQQAANRQTRGATRNGRLPTGRGGQFQNTMHFFPQTTQP